MIVVAESETLKSLINLNRAVLLLIELNCHALSTEECRRLQVGKKKALEKLICSE